MSKNQRRKANIKAKKEAEAKTAAKAAAANKNKPTTDSPDNTNTKPVIKSAHTTGKHLCYNCEDSECKGTCVCPCCGKVYSSKQVYGCCWFGRLRCNRTKKKDDNDNGDTTPAGKPNTGGKHKVKSVRTRLKDSFNEADTNIFVPDKVNNFLFLVKSLQHIMDVNGLDPENIKLPCITSKSNISIES